jgi:hypothetical protein
VLVREWDRRLQRVMVLADGFAWSGQTYDSLSKVAFAIMRVSRDREHGFHRIMSNDFRGS